MDIHDSEIHKDHTKGADIKYSFCYYDEFNDDEFNDDATDQPMMVTKPFDS